MTKVQMKCCLFGGSHYWGGGQSVTGGVAGTKLIQGSEWGDSIMHMMASLVQDWGALYSTDKRDAQWPRQSQRVGEAKCAGGMWPLMLQHRSG